MYPWQYRDKAMGAPPRCGGGSPSGLGLWPRCRSALCLRPGRLAPRACAPGGPAWRWTKDSCHNCQVSLCKMQMHENALAYQRANLNPFLGLLNCTSWVPHSRGLDSNNCSRYGCTRLSHPEKSVYHDFRLSHPKVITQESGLKLNERPNLAGPQERSQTLIVWHSNCDIL